MTDQQQKKQEDEVARDAIVLPEWEQKVAAASVAADDYALQKVTQDYTKARSDALSEQADREKFEQNRGNA